MSLTLDGTNKIQASELNSQTIGMLQPKNWIINGGFDVWQRGTSQTSSGYGSDDRWHNIHTTSTKTHYRQSFTIGQIEVPNNPTYFSRTIVTSGATSSSNTRSIQRIEDVTKLASKTISLSFWAKADANKNISIEFSQNFGTGGSSDVLGLGVQKFALTTSWQKFTKTFTLPSVSGKTIGNQSGTFDIANVSLVEGSVPIEWQTEAYADVLRQCQRYCYNVFGSLTENSALYSHLGLGFAQSSTSSVIDIDLPKNLRTVPSSISYSGNLVLNWIDSAVTATSITIESGRTSNKILAVVVATAGGLTAYRPLFLMRFNTNTATFIVECEL